MNRIDIWKKYVLAAHFDNNKEYVYDFNIPVKLSYIHYKQGSLCKLDIHPKYMVQEYRYDICNHDSIVEYSKCNKTLYFRLPSEIDGMAVISVGKIIGSIYDEVLCSGHVVRTVDCSQSQFENILIANNMFEGLYRNVKLILPIGKHTLKPVTVRDMFEQSRILNINEVINSIDCSSVYESRRMFSGFECDELDLTQLKFESAEIVSSMFYDFRGNAVRFNDNAFQNVVSARSMFEKSHNIKEIDIRCFHYRKLTDMANMFYKCSSLEKIEANWDSIFNEEDGCAFYPRNMIDNLFGYCHELREIDVAQAIDLIVRLYPWDTEKYFDKIDVFSSCYKLRFLSEYTPYILGYTKDSEIKTKLWGISHVRVYV